MAGPCDLQADLVGCVDDARQTIDDLGLRPELVEIFFSRLNVLRSIQERYADTA